MKLWKAVKSKSYCCESCNRGSYKQHKKINKVSLKKRARLMMKKFWKKEID